MLPSPQSLRPPWVLGIRQTRFPQDSASAGAHLSAPSSLKTPVPSPACSPPSRMCYVPGTVGSPPILGALSCHYMMIHSHSTVGLRNRRIGVTPHVTPSLLKDRISVLPRKELRDQSQTDLGSGPSPAMHGSVGRGRLQPARCPPWDGVTPPPPLPAEAGPARCPPSRKAHSPGYTETRRGIKTDRKSGSQPVGDRGPARSCRVVTAMPVLAPRGHVFQPWGPNALDHDACVQL